MVGSVIGADRFMDDINTYQLEQLDALQQVQKSLAQMGFKKRAGLMKLIQPYLAFRKELQLFLNEHLGRFCTQACFNSQSSACCSKDGIIIFWADMVINACCCTDAVLNGLISAIKKPLYDIKCIYLGSDGCLWKVTPLVCAMFVCDQAQADAINQNPLLLQSWERYRTQAKAFRWPDRPVLFDQLEEMFIDLGCQSALMYINSSPGLRQIKKRAGLIKSVSRNPNRSGKHPRTF